MTIPASMKERLAAIVAAIAQGPMPTLAQWRFDEAGVRSARGGRRLLEDKDYFGVTLDRLHLAAGRQWWSTYDPLVYIEVEFLYGDSRIAVPRLLGPAAIRRQLPAGLAELPHGFSVRSLPVIGPLPYRGGPVVITVVLYKIQHTNYAKAILSFLESLSSATGLGKLAETYLQIGGVLTDAVDTLFHMGEAVPLLGHQVGLAAQPGDGLRAQTVALLSGAADDAGARFVDGRLLRGEGGEPDAFDHAIYTVWPSDAPSREAELAFRTSFERMTFEASRGTDESWGRAKGMLMAVYAELIASADLFAPDADRLFETQRARMKEVRDRARETALMSIETRGDKPVADDARRLDAMTRSVLEL